MELGGRGGREGSRAPGVLFDSMRNPPKVPTIVFKRARDRTPWRWLAGSTFVHALVIFLLVWDWSHPEFPQVRTPGGPGPVGGGGGGGGPRVTYVALPAYQPPRERTEPQEQRPEQVIIPTPDVVPVDIKPPEFEMPKVEAQTEVGASVLGRGPGTGGGPGAGTGTGGGIGSGRGTGVGSGVGRGCGGEGGDVFPPAPRYGILPPQPRPKSVQGKTFYARFTVGVDGRVLGVEISPRIGDSDYRRRLVAQLFQWTFAPAMTREGVPVRGETVVTFTL
jgi:protein TonB